MSEFEKVFNKYTVISILLLVIIAVSSVVLSIFLKGDGNFFSVTSQSVNFRGICALLQRAFFVY